jgi:hypothetical protein
MDIGLHLKHHVFLSDFNEILSTDFGKKKKYSYIKFHEDAFRESRFVGWGRMDERKNGQTDRYATLLCGVYY